MAQKYYWLKLQRDFFQQKQIKKLRKIAGGDTYTIICLEMYLLSLEHEGVIVFEGVEETLEDELALALDETVDDVKMTLLFLQSQSLIETLSDTEYLLPAVVMNVGSETQSAERMRRLREKPQVSQCDALPSHCDSDVQKCDTEKERELEKKEIIGADEPPTSTPKPKQVKFSPPSVEDVKAYCMERGNKINPEHFIDFYASKGWLVGKTKMKDWRASLRTWERNNSSAQQPSAPKPRSGKIEIIDGEEVLVYD